MEIRVPRAYPFFQKTNMHASCCTHCFILFETLRIPQTQQRFPCKTRKGNVVCSEVEPLTGVSNCSIMLFGGVYRVVKRSILAQMFRP